MANRVIDAVLRLTDNFTGPATKSIRAMTSMSKAGVKVGKDIEKAGKSITQVGKGLTTAITVPLLGAATAAVKTAADFESSMSNVHAIMGDTYDDSLAQFAQQLGATTAWSAQEVSQAMQYTGMAGWTAQENIEGLKGILDLASASGTELALTSDIVTDAISAFGYTAADSGRFADVMTAACTNANVSVETLGESYKYCGALAGTMGYELDQVTTALAVMGNQGIKGSQAGTALRSAISNLSAPTKQMKEGMDALGISIKNQDGSLKSFEEVIDNVRSSFGRLGEAEQAAYAKQIFGKQAMAGMLAIVNTSEEEYEKLAVAIDKSGGAADTAAKTQLDNLSGQLTLLKSATEGTAIAFGNRMLPYLKRAVTWVQGLMEKINGLSDAQIDNIIKWAGMAAAAGPAIMIFGKVVSTIGRGVQIFNKLGIAIKAAGGVMGLLTSPVMIVIGVIAALAAIVLIVRSHMDVFKASLSGLGPIFESIKGHVQSIITKFREIWTVVGPIVTSVANLFGSVLTAAIGAAVTLVGAQIDNMLMVFDNILLALQGVIDFLTGVFTGNWELAWNGIGEIVTGVCDGILGFFKGMINGLINAINGFLGGLNGLTIPSWVPVVGGKTFSMPQIPTLGVGTEYWPGGLAQIHERGGEIIDLPRGSRVYPHDESMAMARREGMASASQTITIAKLADQIIVREQADIERIGDAIVRKLKKANDNRGGWTFDGVMA